MKPIGNLILCVKDFVLKHSLLLIKRNMFYIENPSPRNYGYTIIEAVDNRYKNMTHREWFGNMNVDITSVTRGYYYNGVIKIYDGIDHTTPKVDVTEKAMCAYRYFSDRGKHVESIHLGGKPNALFTLLGINWIPSEILIVQ